MEISRDKATNAFAVLSQTKSRTAHQVALSTPLAAHLGYNPHLHPALWDEVRRAVVDTADDFDAYCALLKTVPNSSRADEILTYPGNAYTLSQLLPSCVEKLSQAAVDQIISLPTFDVLLAAPLIASGRLPAHLVMGQMHSMVERGELLKLTPLPVTFGELLECALSKYDVLPDEFVLDILLKPNLFRLNPRRILDYRPTLIAPLLARITELQLLNRGGRFRLDAYLTTLQAIALSQHLTTKNARALLKLLNPPTMLRFEVPAALNIITTLLKNPSVSPFNKSLAVARFEHILPYCPKQQPHQHQYSLKDLTAAKAALREPTPRIRTTWDKATASQAPRVRAAVSAFGSSSYPTLYPIYPPGLEIEYNPQELLLTERYVNKDLSPKLDAAGPTAWEIFLATLPTWYGDIQDLALIAASTATTR